MNGPAAGRRFRADARARRKPENGPERRSGAAVHPIERCRAAWRGSRHGCIAIGRRRRNDRCVETARRRPVPAILPAPCRSCLESNMFLLCSYRFRIRRKESSGFLRILSLSGRPERVRCAAENPRNRSGISVYAGIWPEAAKDENGSNLPDPHLARPAFSLA